MLAQNETCTECHDTQRGPHVFEHEAMREGCTSCHHPHGAVNDKLLTQRNSTLCLKCHFQQQSGGLILIGGQDHTSLLSRGSCWSAGCHEAVHGSQVNSSLRY
jgi:predicted CXXCH cytochrome family protein